MAIGINPEQEMRQNTYQSRDNTTPQLHQAKPTTHASSAKTRNQGHLVAQHASVAAACAGVQMYRQP
jgi:hypothetical protein